MISEHCKDAENYQSEETYGERGSGGPTAATRLLRQSVNSIWHLDCQASVSRK